MDDAEARNAVARAVDVAGGLIDQWDVSGGKAWPDEMTQAMHAVRDALIAAGVEPRRAEWAKTRWVITRQDVWRCVDEVNEDGPIHGPSGGAGLAT